MPFVTQKVDAGVRKRCEGDDHDFEPLNKGLEDLFDPELLADITALQELYRNAMTGMSAAVERARNLLAQQGRTMDLRLFQEVFASQAVADLRRSLGSISDETARQVLAEVSVALMRLQPQVAGVLRFNDTDPRAIAWAEQRAGAMIKQIETEALQAVRNAISRVLLSGGGIQRATTDISRVIGLHDRWQRAVDNYYSKETIRLNRTMGLDNAIVEAQRLAVIYRDKLIRARAENIARTEVLAAQNIGQLLSWLQAADDGFLDLSRAEKEWVVGPDGWRGIAVCEICQGLAGERTTVQGLFSNGEISPPAHPSCRCTMNLIALADLEEPEIEDEE